MLEFQKGYRKLNHERLKDYHSQYRAKVCCTFTFLISQNPERFKLYEERNKEKKSEYKKNYAVVHKEDIAEYKKNYRKRKREELESQLRNNPQYRVGRIHYPSLLLILTLHVGRIRKASEYYVHHGLVQP